MEQLLPWGSSALWVNTNCCSLALGLHTKSFEAVCWPPLRSAISEGFLSSSFLPVVLFPSQVPWLPFHSRAHDAVSPPGMLPSHSTPRLPPFPPHTPGQAAANPAQPLKCCCKVQRKDISVHCCVIPFGHRLRRSAVLCFMLTVTFLNVSVVLGD